MNTEDAQYINTSIEEEGFDYCFDGYSSFKDIKDEHFHALRQKYLNAKKDLKHYIQMRLKKQIQDIKKALINLLKIIIYHWTIIKKSPNIYNKYKIRIWISITIIYFQRYKFIEVKSKK